MGRTEPIDVVFSTAVGGMVGGDAFDADLHLAALHELAEIGVTWASGGVTGTSLAEIEENLARYGDEIISSYA